MSSLLIIDDEPNVCYSLQRALESPKLKISAAGTAREGLERIRQDPPDAVILDVRLLDMSGLDACARIRQIDARLPVIVITAHGGRETAVEAMKLGAFEHLLKPLDRDKLSNAVGRAIHLNRIGRIPATFDKKQEPHVEDDQFTGSSPPIQDPHKSIGRTAPQEAADRHPPNLQEKSSRGELLAAEKSVELAVARRVRETLATKCGHIYYQIQAAVDRVVLREVLEHAKGNQVEAADLLGISRTTLRSKLRALGLVVEKQVSDSPD